MSAVPKNRGFARSFKCGMLSLTTGVVAAFANEVKRAKNNENGPNIFRGDIFLSFSRLFVGATAVGVER